MTHPQERMSDRLLDQGDGLIVAFPAEDVDVAGQNDLAALRAYFLKVSSVQDFYLDYNQLGSFTSGDTTNYGYLGESGHEQRVANPGQDVFRIEEDDWHAYHFGYAPVSPNLNVYHKISQASQADTAINRRGDTEGVAPGDDDSYVNRARARTELDPGAVTERASIRNDDDGELLEWGFEATDDISADAARIIFTGAGYKLLPVTDDQEQARLLQLAQTGGQDDDIDVTMVQLGGLYSYRVGQIEPDSWGDVDDSRGMTRTLTWGTQKSGSGTNNQRAQRTQL